MGLTLRKVLGYALTDIRTVGNDFSIVFFLEPKEQNGGIEPPGVGDENFHEGGRQS